MKKLVILSGIPGSGKSHFSTTIKGIKGSHVYIVSSDLLRKEMLGSQRDFSMDNKMWKIFYLLPTIYSEDEDAFVILDATHIKSELRIKVKKDMDNYFDEIYLVSFYLDKETVIRQNKEREYPVPDDVLEQFYDNFELPTEEEYKLFTEVFLVSNNDLTEIIKKII